VKLYALKWRMLGPLEHWYSTTALHDFTTQETSTSRNVIVSEGKSRRRLGAFLKVKLSLCFLTEHHAIKAYCRSRGIAPHIL
jgi:hypothetical protein